MFLFRNFIKAKYKNDVNYNMQRFQIYTHTGIVATLMFICHLILYLLSCSIEVFMDLNYKLDHQPVS